MNGPRKPGSDSPKDGGPKVKGVGVEPVAPESVAHPQALGSANSQEALAGVEVERNFQLVADPCKLSVQGAADAIWGAIHDRDERFGTAIPVLDRNAPQWMYDIASKFDEVLMGGYDHVVEAMGATAETISKAKTSDQMEEATGWGCSQDSGENLLAWMSDHSESLNVIDEYVGYVRSASVGTENFDMCKILQAVKAEFYQEVGRLLLFHLQATCPVDQDRDLSPDLQAFAHLRALVERDPAVTGLEFTARPGGEEGYFFNTYVMRGVVDTHVNEDEVAKKLFLGDGPFEDIEAYILNEQVEMKAIDADPTGETLLCVHLDLDGNLSATVKE